MAILKAGDDSLQFDVLEHDPLLLPTGFHSDWQSLEERALEPNFYLSPYFALPAVQHLAAKHSPKIYAVHVLESQVKKLVGLAILGKSGSRKEFPLPQMVAYHSPHSYLSGFLLDAEYGKQALQCLFEFLQQSRVHGDGIWLQDWQSDSPQGRMIHSVASEAGMVWHSLYSYERAILRPAKVDDEQYRKSLTNAGGKDLERRIRRLKELGEISSRVLWGKQVTEDTIDRFLALEDREWAREQKTSLLAAGHETFLRQVCEPLRDASRMFVAELLLNGDPIASTINFTAGNQGFAFKIGWEQKLAKFSPGIVNELWFMREVNQSCSHLTQIDSGASADSFINKIWPDRTTLSTGIFVSSMRGKLVSRAIELARAVKRFTK
jgi:hypothetical protein